MKRENEDEALSAYVSEVEGAQNTTDEGTLIDGVYEQKAVPMFSDEPNVNEVRQKRLEYNRNVSFKWWTFSSISSIYILYN